MAKAARTVGHLISRSKAAGQHLRQTVAHHVDRLRQAQPKYRLPRQHFELEDGIERRSSALRWRSAPQRLGQNPTENLEIDSSSKRLKRIALRRQFLQTVLERPKTPLTLHRSPSPQIMQSVNPKTQKSASFRRCQSASSYFGMPITCSSVNRLRFTSQPICTVQNRLSRGGNFTHINCLKQYAKQ